MIPGAVYTSPREINYLHGTLASLAWAGWAYPTLAHDECRAGPWPTLLKTLGVLCRLEPDADGYALFQDDILVAKGCKAWLEAQDWPSPLVGVLSLYAAEDTARGRQRGWCRLDAGSLPSAAYGACAVVLPREAARLLLADPPGRGSKAMADVLLATFCQRAKLEWWFHVPSLVRHVGEVSSVAGRGGAAPSRPWSSARHEGPFVADVAELSSPVVG